MIDHSLLHRAVALSAALVLSGCLVSEEPLLDDRNGRGRPLASGAYQMCPAGEDADADDCEIMIVSRDRTGLYVFAKDDDDPAEMRFRRIGRKGYAVQSREDDDLYQYYYGAGDSSAFHLTMMLCADLPDDLRSRLIDRGDLSSDDDDFETCTVNTLRGLTSSARAYHRGEIESDEEIALVFTPTDPRSDQ